MTKAIEINGLSVTYSNGTLAVENVSFSVEKGEFINIIGPNGAGKTTILNTILGTVSPNKGTVKVLGGNVKKNRIHIGYVPQNTVVDKDFPITVLEAVETSFLKPGLDPFRKYKKSHHEKAYEILKSVDLGEYSDRRISEFSGGEFQRMLIARALARDPDILLLDEPTANVDAVSSEKIYRILKKLNTEGVTVILVSHDLQFVTESGMRTICINKTVTFDGMANDKIIKLLR